MVFAVTTFSVSLAISCRIGFLEWIANFSPGLYKKPLMRAELRRVRRSSEAPHILTRNIGRLSALSGQVDHLRFTASITAPFAREGWRAHAIPRLLNFEKLVKLPMPFHFI
ncbi:MAG TPA: hypothetical protein VK604_10260 [Bryobacteraceae bacterium]|nr:hypothetical protein [Bryobacteraceae bacterium]